MKTPRTRACCVRCGTGMLPEEALLSQNGDLCGFCENMHAEALQIYQTRASQPKLKVFLKLHVVPQREV